MKNSLICLAMLAGIGFAQDAQKNTPATPPADGGEKLKADDGEKPKADGGEKPKVATGVLRRLESVTWSPMQLEVRWLVSVWDLANPEQPRDLERYVVHLDSKVMELNGKARDLQDAGQDLSGILDLIGANTMRATAWWRNVENAAPDAQPNGAQPNTTQPNAAPDGSGSKDDKSKEPAKKDLPQLKPIGNWKIAQNEQLPRAAAPPAKTDPATARDPRD